MENNKEESLEKELENLEAKKKELEELKTSVVDYEAKKNALLKETERQMRILTKIREDKRNAQSEKDNNTNTDEIHAEIKKLREEQKNYAFEEFIEEYPEYKDGNSKVFLEKAFAAVDSGSNFSKNIKKDLLKAHALINAEKLVGLEKEIKDNKNNIKDFQMDNMSNAGKSAASHEDKSQPIHPKLKGFLSKAGISEEQYKKYGGEEHTINI